MTRTPGQEIFDSNTAGLNYTRCLTAEGFVTGEPCAMPGWCWYVLIYFFSIYISIDCSSCWFGCFSSESFASKYSFMHFCTTPLFRRYGWSTSLFITATAPDKLWFMTDLFVVFDTLDYWQAKTNGMLFFFCVFYKWCHKSPVYNFLNACDRSAEHHETNVRTWLQSLCDWWMDYHCDLIKNWYQRVKHFLYRRTYVEIRKIPTRLINRMS